VLRVGLAHGAGHSATAHDGIGHHAPSRCPGLIPAGAGSTRAGRGGIRCAGEDGSYRRTAGTAAVSMTTGGRVITPMA
jgi:hypothetical protein